MPRTLASRNASTAATSSATAASRIDASPKRRAGVSSEATGKRQERRAHTNPKEVAITSAASSHASISNWPTRTQTTAVESSATPRTTRVRASRRMVVSTTMSIRMRSEEACVAHTAAAGTMSASSTKIARRTWGFDAVGPVVLAPSSGAIAGVSDALLMGAGVSGETALLRLRRRVGRHRASGSAVGHHGLGEERRRTRRLTGVGVGGRERG